MPDRSLDIVIVNWNAGPQLADCLRSLASHPPHDVTIARVVVVDNASEDGSADDLESIAGLPLTVIRNESNRGLAAGCNQGAAGSTADYLLFLNPDTRVHEGALDVPAAFLHRPENADVGIVSVQLVDESGHVSRTCARLPTPGRFIAFMARLDRLLPKRFPGHFLDDWDHADTRQVDQVMGAFFFTRRNLFEELGGFDERFFVYLEEVDFSLRARTAGWKTYFLSEAQVYHRGGGTSEQAKADRIHYVLRSRILYFYRHFPRSAAAAYLAAVLSLEFIARLAQAAGRRSPEEIKETLIAYRRLWAELGETRDTTQT